MKYSAAIDLGGTNIGVGIVGEDGTLISSASVPVEDASCAEGLISQIAFAIRLGAQGADMKVSDLSFVGVGIPGICSGEKGPVFLRQTYSGEISTLPVFLRKRPVFRFFLPTTRIAPPLANITSARAKTF